MPHTSVERQAVTIYSKLRKTNYTYGSGGWEVEVWMAWAYAPGRVLSVTQISFSNPGWIHPLRWFVPDEQRKIYEVALDYFNLSVTGNPYWHDNFMLAIVTKNGGPVDVSVGFTAECEIPPSDQQSVSLRRPLA